MNIKTKDLFRKKTDFSGTLVKRTEQEVIISLKGLDYVYLFNIYTYTVYIFLKYISYISILIHYI